MWFNVGLIFSAIGACAVAYYSRTLKTIRNYIRFFIKLTNKYLFPSMQYTVPFQDAYDFPLPPFPNTWYPICMAHEIKPGQIYPKQIAGHDIVVYRNSLFHQEIYVNARHCPHMGVDLKYGTIKHECIVCPFHHHCVSPLRSNQAIREPEHHRVKYKVQQHCGIVFVWIGDVETPTVSLKKLCYEFFSHDYFPKLYKWGLFDRKVGGHLVDYAEHLLDVSHAPYTHGVELQAVKEMLQTFEHSFRVTFRIKGYNIQPKFTYMTPTFGFVDYGNDVKTFIMFVVEDVGQIRMIQLPIYYRHNWSKTVKSWIAALYTHFDFSEEAAFFSTKKHRNRNLTAAEEAMDKFRQWFLKTYYTKDQIETFQNNQKLKDTLSW